MNKILTINKSKNNINNFNLKDLQNKDPYVFTKLFNKYKVRIYNYLLLKSKLNNDIANEVLCDTFYYAWLSISSLSNTKNLCYWLITIAGRRLSDYLRKVYRDDKYLKFFIEPENYVDKTIEKMHNKKQALLINIALGNIKPLYKKILKLRYYENKTQKEISKIFNTTEASVQCRLYRARIALKKELKKTKGFIYNEFR